MLKIIVAIFLCVILLIQPVSDLLIVLSYVLNKEFIATVLCINRDKPELNCEGKCQVTEQFKEKEKKKNNTEGTVTNKIDVILFLPAKIESLFPPVVTDKYHISYKQNILSTPPFPIFHPPKDIYC